MSGDTGQKVGVIMENTQIEYEFANIILAKYFQKDYPDYCVTGNITYEKRIGEDAWGFDYDYYIFSGGIIISKEETILGKSVILMESRLLSHEKIEKTLVKAIQDELDNDQYEITNVYPTKKYIGVSIKIKEKKLVKKVNNYEN